MIRKGFWKRRPWLYRKFFFAIVLQKNRHKITTLPKLCEWAHVLIQSKQLEELETISPPPLLHTRKMRVAGVAWSSSRLGRPGFESRQGKKIFSSPKHPERLGSPYGLLFSGYLGSPSVVQQSGPEFNHSLPRGAEVQSGRSCRSVPLMCLCGVDSETSTFYSTLMKKVSLSSGRVCTS